MAVQVVAGCDAGTRGDRSVGNHRARRCRRFAGGGGPDRQGHTKLIFNQNTSGGLDALGIGILPIPPAEARSGGESFPITRGTVSRNGRSARIHHDGGITFVGDNTQSQGEAPRGAPLLS